MNEHLRETIQRMQQGRRRAMMTPAEMAKEKTILEATLRGIAILNVADKTTDELAAMTLRQIEIERRLVEINRMIRAYINGE